jgi:hypothetical protein
MKKIYIYNGEARAVTVVTDLETVTIPGLASATVKMDDEASFNAPDGSFYILEEYKSYIKTEFYSAEK